MKKITLAIVLILSLTLLSATAYADAEELVTGMAKKLWRGLVNTFTGWIEIPAQTIKGAERGFADDEDNKIMGVGAGLVRGVYHAVGRTMWGASEFAGFWAASPESNESIGLHLDAEYAWEEGTPDYFLKSDFLEGTLAPMGNKFLRGVGNAVGGVLEVPGQIAKGIENAAPDIGIIKGVWYWFSREVGGMYDIITCLFPNPEDTKGMAFDEKWPWSALGDSFK